VEEDGTIAAVMAVVRKIIVAVYLMAGIAAVEKNERGSEDRNGRGGNSNSWSSNSNGGGNRVAGGGGHGQWERGHDNEERFDNNDN